MDIRPVKEALYAVDHYANGKGCQCVAITNAEEFDRQAQELAQQEGVILVDRRRLALWPNHIV